MMKFDDFNERLTNDTNYSRTSIIRHSVNCPWVIRPKSDYTDNFVF